AFNRLADDYEGIAHAEVTTAVPLTDEQLASIRARLGQQLGKQVVATARVDPAIIGGAIVRVGDRLIDGSVRTRLKLLRRELEGAR
ncbi:MAG: ATP synthase F1 subunit delta, partial [Tepidiforma sp.]